MKTSKVETQNTCGCRLVQLLENCGTEFIFGIPGVHTVGLYAGIAGSQIRHITPRHEQSAGFMADGYARATGKYGVCCLITGPGLTNAATPLAQSYSDSVPVLAISSVNKINSLGMGEGDLHELPNQQQLAEQFTAFSHTVLDVDTVPDVMALALAVFHSMRPRPVHIQIPIDRIEQEVNWSPLPLSLPSPPQPPDDQLREAAVMLKEAKNPVVILGGGCINGSDVARQFIETYNSPVVLTFAAKGVISPEHPLCIGANLLHPSVMNYVENADIILAVGTEVAETDIWIQDGDVHPKGKVIRIDIDPSQLHRNMTPHLGIVGDAKLALEQLTDLLGPNREKFAKWRVTHEKAVRKMLIESRQNWFRDSHKHALVWDVIREVLPDDGIVTADSTQMVYTGNFYYPAQQPRTYLTSTTGYGTLGYGLPAAIGAKLGKPDTPVVCVVGDGGFLFTIQELATAVANKLPIVIVLWHNHGYGEIRDAFDQLNIPQTGVNLDMPDFIAVAKGFGCQAERITGLDHFRRELIKGLEGDRPTVLEIQAKAEFLNQKQPKLGDSELFPSILP